MTAGWDGTCLPREPWTRRGLEEEEEEENKEKKKKKKEVLRNES